MNELFDPIKVHSTITNSIIVAFSGGKDSIVTLELCKKYFKNVICFHMYLIPNLEFQEKALNYYEKRYNVEILRIPHPDFSEFLKYGTYRTPDYSINTIDFNDCYNYIRSITGYKYIATGERLNDSIIRRATLKNSGSIDFKRARMFPVMYWNKQQIYSYIKKKRLYLPNYSKNNVFSFSSLSGKELTYIRDNYPCDFQQIKKYFPLVETAVKRYETYNI